MKFALVVLFAVAIVAVLFGPICWDWPAPPGCTVVCEEPLEEGLCPECHVVCPDPNGGN